LSVRVTNWFLTLDTSRSKGFHPKNYIFINQRATTSRTEMCQYPEITDWWQINGDGSVYYLGATVTGSYWAPCQGSGSSEGSGDGFLNNPSFYDIQGGGETEEEDNPTGNNGKSLSELGKKYKEEGCMFGYGVLNQLGGMNIVDPCNTKVVSTEIIESILDELCDEDKEGEINVFDIDDFWGKLGSDGNEYIIEELDFKNCPKLYCVYQDLQFLDNSLFCDMYLNIKESTNGALFISMGHSTFGYGGEVSFADGMLNTIDMKFNQFYCEDATDYLEIAQTIIHEFLHADFRFDINTTSSEKFNDEWDEYVKNVLKLANSDEHWVMIVKYMEKTAKDLKDLNGDKFTLDHYMWLVWNGGLSNWFPDAFPQSQIEEWKNLYNEVINDEDVYECNP
jgi:hypothetical protein